MDFKMEEIHDKIGMAANFFKKGIKPRVAKIPERRKPIKRGGFCQFFRKDSKKTRKKETEARKETLNTEAMEDMIDTFRM